MYLNSWNVVIHLSLVLVTQKTICCQKSGFYLIISFDFTLFYCIFFNIYKQKWILKLLIYFDNQWNYKLGCVCVSKTRWWLCLYRVAENESINKMSLHNLATVFGPTLLRPSEKDSKLPSTSQPLSMNDSWSLEVMAQVKPIPKRQIASLYGLEYLRDRLLVFLFEGSGPSLFPSAGEHSSPRQQAAKPPLLYGSMTGTRQTWTVTTPFWGRMSGSRCPYFC